MTFYLACSSGTAFCSVPVSLVSLDTRASSKDAHIAQEATMASAVAEAQKVVEAMQAIFYVGDSADLFQTLQTGHPSSLHVEESDLLAKERAENLD